MRAQGHNTLRSQNCDRAAGVCASPLLPEVCKECTLCSTLTETDASKVDTAPTRRAATSHPAAHRRPLLLFNNSLLLLLLSLLHLAGLLPQKAVGQ